MTAHFPFEKLNRPDGEFVAYLGIPQKEKSKNNCEVVFCGGFMSDMSGTKAAFLRDLGVQENFPVTTFDYYGHGLSSGEFTKGTISRWLEDTLAIIDEVTSGPLILVGSSMGGWLMTLAALRRPNRVKGLIGLASAPDFTEDLIWKELPEPTQNKLRTEGIIYTPSEYSEKGYPITRELIEDGRKNLILRHKIPLEIPIHLIHGTEDHDVSWKYSCKLMEKVESHNVTVSLVKGADHRLSTPEDLRRLAKAIEDMQTFLK